ncbi:MAG: ATP-binding protein [Rivularia sp. (in: cyanobacteria)]
MPRFDRLGYVLNESSQNEKMLTDNNDISQDKSVNSYQEKSSSEIDFLLYLREPKYSINDVILPVNVKRQFDLILGEIQNKDLIDNTWGIAEKHKLDKSQTINYSGLPGTGKTITAEVFASAVNKKLLAVPYHLIESKYVGETPKNIVRTFEFATENDAVLFFDEADSFLGKRLENVTQATDTAVNLTRSVMLMQLSSFEGIVIFATNLIQNYDPAFISRIRWKLQFELPDEAARVEIWKAQIPNKLPLDSSVNFEKLASKFDKISGRDIKNAVLQAVVAAASENKPNDKKCVTQSHFAEAITEIIEANQAAIKPEFTLNSVENITKLPPQQSPSN